jgi:acylphosphatase
VRNLRDGRVEVWAQGDGQAVEGFVDWLWQGPPAAVVRGVESNDVTPDGTLQDFLIVN